MENSKERNLKPSKVGEMLKMPSIELLAKREQQKSGVQLKSDSDKPSLRIKTQIDKATNRKVPVMSVYRDQRLSQLDVKERKDCIRKSINLLFTAFPEMMNVSGFSELLAGMITEEDFTVRRLEDSVKHMIRTCPYKTFRVASIISYDRTVRVYTYQEVQSLCTPRMPMDKQFKVIPETKQKGVQTLWERII